MWPKANAPGCWPSAGKPCMIVDLCIRDENGVDLPPGQIGEIALRGKSLMTGYWKNPETDRQGR